MLFTKLFKACGINRNNEKFMNLEQSCLKSMFLLLISS